MVCSHVQSKYRCAKNDQIEANKSEAVMNVCLFRQREISLHLL